MSDQSDLDGIELQASHGTRHSVRHDFPQPKSCLLAAGGFWPLAGSGALSGSLAALAGPRKKNHGLAG